MKKMLNKVRKAVVITITSVASIYLLLYLLSLDSQTVNQLMIGGMIACLCGMWICSFLYANYPEYIK